MPRSIAFSVAVRKCRADRAMETLRRISSYASSGGRKFTREEMNERR